MQWREDGIVLNIRIHGERSSIVSIFTCAQGRHMGLWRSGARSQKSSKFINAGDYVDCTWKARLEDHLGSYSLEKLHSTSAVLFDDTFKLLALTSACALLEVCLPERAPHQKLFDQTKQLFEILSGEDKDWVKHYVLWELSLLNELGFALKLDKCAATGVTSNLTHVSPKSARAVSAEAAAPYLNKLLPLPRFVIADSKANHDEILDGFSLTEFFLDRHAMSLSGRHLPASRARFVESFRKTNSLAL